MLVGFGFWRFFPIEWGVSLASGVLVAATIVSVVHTFRLCLRSHPADGVLVPVRYNGDE